MGTTWPLGSTYGVSCTSDEEDSDWNSAWVGLCAHERRVPGSQKEPRRVPLVAPNDNHGFSVLERKGDWPSGANGAVRGVFGVDDEPRSKSSAVVADDRADDIRRGMLKRLTGKPVFARSHEAGAELLQLP